MRCVGYWCRLRVCMREPCAWTTRGQGSRVTSRDGPMDRPMGHRPSYHLEPHRELASTARDSTARMTTPKLQASSCEREAGRWSLPGRSGSVPQGTDAEPWNWHRAWLENATNVPIPCCVSANSCCQADVRWRQWDGRAMRRRDPLDIGCRNRLQPSGSEKTPRPSGHRKTWNQLLIRKSWSPAITAGAVPAAGNRPPADGAAASFFRPAPW